MKTMHPSCPNFTVDEVNHVADWFETLMFKSRTNQTKFAREVLNVSQPSCNQMLKGKRPIPQAHIVEICQHFGVSASEYKKVIRKCPRYKQMLDEHLLSAEQLLAWHKE